MIVQSVLKNMFPSAFQTDARDLTPRDMVVRKASAHKGFKFGLTLLVIIALMGIFGPMLLGTSPFEQDLTQRLLPPVWVSGGSWEHSLGTDGNGRDYLGRWHQEANGDVERAARKCGRWCSHGRRL
jgi:ABC-type dipeptide/oligopeptide/nickel transport system permease subunit